MAVRKRGDRNNPAFPSWLELLKRAAKMLDSNNQPAFADTVRMLIAETPPDLFTAATKAKNNVSLPTWVDFLKEQFDLQENDMEPASLGLPKLIWRLGSRMVITTNYDRVMKWSCDDTHAIEWGIENPFENVQLVNNDLVGKAIWHLHGTVIRTFQLILTPDEYELLYSSASISALETKYEATLHALRGRLTHSHLLFVGFSFADRYLQEQLKWLTKTYEGAAGPHFALVHKDRLPQLREPLRQVGVECISYAAHGPPLIALLQKLVALVPPPPQGDGLEEPPPEPIRPPPRGQSTARPKWADIATRMSTIEALLGKVLGALSKGAAGARDYDSSNGVEFDPFYEILTVETQTEIYEKAIALHDEALRILGGSPLQEVRPLRAKALADKASVLQSLGKIADEMKTLDELLSMDDAPAELLASAQLQKGLGQMRAGKLLEAIETFKELEEQFGDSNEPTIRDLVLRASYNRADAWCRGNGRRTAITILSTEPWGSNAIWPPKTAIGIMALMLKGRLLMELRSYQEAVDTFDMVVTAQCPDPDNPESYVKGQQQLAASIKARLIQALAA